MNQSLENLPSNLDDASLTIKVFPYQFTIDFKGNEYCEDLIKLFTYQFHKNGIKEAVICLNAANASFEIYTVGNVFQRFLTSRWLSKHLAEVI